MRACEPDRKWKLVKEAVSTDMLLNDNFLLLVVDVIKGIREDANVLTAVELIEDYEWRDGVVAYILSSAPFEQIAKSLWLPVEVVGYFSTLFLDLNSFKHKLEFRRYADYYANNVCKDLRMKDLLKKGVIEGPESLEDYWWTPGDELSVTYGQMAKRLAQMSYMKALTGRHSALNEDVTKESLKWCGSALRIISDKDHFVDFDSSGENAVLALDSVDLTHRPEEAGIRLEDIIN